MSNNSTQPTLVLLLSGGQRGAERECIEGREATRIMVLDFIKSGLIKELRQTHGWFRQIWFCPKLSIMFW